MTEGMKVVFTYHAMDRVEQRHPELSQAAIAAQLSDPNNWLMQGIDQEYGDNKGDGVKLNVTIKVAGRQVKVTLKKKVEHGRDTLVILTVNPPVTFY